MPIRHFTCTALVFSLSAFQSAHAAGYAIAEQGASGLGSAYSAGATNISDASAVWSNPAAITQFEQPEISAAGHIINISYDFTDQGSTLPAATGGAAIQGDGTVDAGHAAFVPALFYVRPLNEKLTFGFSLNAPFGLATEYDKDWTGRYQGVKSEVKSINLTPNIAYKINNRLSVGAGISFQYMEAELSTAVDSGSVCLGVSPTTALQADCLANGLAPGVQANDGLGVVTGDSWDVGFNLGVYFELNDAVSLGAAYRSAYTQDLKGDADFSISNELRTALDARGLTQLFTDTGATAQANTPSQLSLSSSVKMDEKLTLMTDFTWSEWSRFEELRIVYDSAQPDTVTDMSWNDVWRFSVGGSYQMNDQWLLRAGLAYDEHAIPNLSHRTPRIPDNDRTWLSFGANYQLNNHTDIDMAFTQLFIDETDIDHTDESGYTTRGTTDANIAILAAQVNWRL